jgi:tRNA threonylcarbamoyladenosine modification (KEOPS) complex Cgi121 subunit
VLPSLAQGKGIRTGDNLLFILNYNNMNKNIIDFSKYDEFIAEQYEKEDEFWKELLEEQGADWNDDF